MKKLYQLTFLLAALFISSGLMAQKSLSYSANFFTESSNDDGTIENTITITCNNFAGETFTGNVGDDFVADNKVTVTNLPSGLTAKIIRKDDLTLIAVLSGAATSHENSNDVSNLTITFKDLAFSGGVASAVSNATKSDLSINFIQIYQVGLTAEYSSIGSVLKICDKDGDIINLAAETFTETGLSVGYFEIDDIWREITSLTIQGEGANNTFIQTATSAEDASGTVLAINIGAKVTLKDLTLRYGTRGIFLNEGDLALENVCIRDNHEVDNGILHASGGIFSFGGNISLINCTINNNSGISYGGGISIRQNTFLKMVNSTIFNNTSPKGAGIYGVDLYEGAGLDITNSTIFYNQGPGISINSGELTILNTMLLGNEQKDYYDFGDVTLNDKGYNIVRYQDTNEASGNWYFNHPNDILYNYNSSGEVSTTWTRNNVALESVNTGIYLELLDNNTLNGTQTIKIEEGMIPIDAGTDVGAPTTDQRGYSRNGTTDIGAYEYDGVYVQKPTVTTSNSSTTYNSTMVTVGGTVTSAGGGTITDRGVVYSLSKIPDLADSIVHIGSGTGSFSQSVPGMLANTTYYIRAYAINSAGVAYGNVDTLRTLIEATTITSTPVTETSYDRGYNYKITATTIANNIPDVTVTSKPDWLTFTDRQNNVTSFGNIPAGTQISGVAGDNEGNIYAITTDGTAIYKIETDETTSMWRSGLLSGTVYALYIAGGYIYIPRHNDDAHSITRIPLNDSLATEETFAEFTGGAVSLTDKDGWIYAAGRGQDKIFRINEITKEQELFLGPSDGLTDVSGLTFGQDGNLYITRLSYQNILKYDGVSITSASPFFIGFKSIWQDAYGDFCLLTSIDETLIKLNKELNQIKGDLASTVGYVESFTITPSGAMVYASYGTNNVYRMQTCPVLTGVPAKSDLGGHSVVLKATNEGGYDEQSFTITVKDLIKPSITAFTPADGATGIFLKPTLSLTFDKEITLGNTGIFSLLSSEGTLVSYNLTDADNRAAFSISEDKKTVSVQLSTALPTNTTIGVEISEDFVKDLNDNSFDGFSYASGTWNFTTIDGNPIISNLNGDSISFTQGATPVIIDTDVNAGISDPDSSGYNGGNLTVAISSVSTTESLSINTSGTVSLSSGMAAGSTISVGSTLIGSIATGNDGQAGNDLVITLNSAATNALLGTLMQNISYSHTSQLPLGTRLLAVSVQDASSLISATAVVSVITIDVNDAPTLTASALNPGYTEQAAAVNLFSDASASTFESGQAFSGFTLTADHLSNGSSEKLTIDGTVISLSNGTSGISSTKNLTYSVSFSDSTATVTLSCDSLPVSDLETIINTLAYSNTSDTPDETTRVVTLTSITDNGGTDNGGVNTTTLSIASGISITGIYQATVSTNSISTFDNHSATMGGNATADGGAGITERGVVYSSVSNMPVIGESSAVKDANGSGTGSFSESISGLADGTTYYVRAYATNSEGTSYGDAESFTTTAAPLSFSSTPELTVAYGHAYNYNIVATTEGGNQGTLTAPTLPNWLSLTEMDTTETVFETISGNNITQAASDEEGNIYLVISDGSKIYKIANDGTTSLWRSTSLSISGICIANGYLYYSHAVSYTDYIPIYRIPLDDPSATPETFSGTFKNGILDLAYQDGWIYFIHYQITPKHYYLYRINETTKEVEEFFDGSTYPITSITAGPDNRIFAGWALGAYNFDQRKLLVFNNDAEETYGAISGFHGYMGPMAVDANRNIYISHSYMYDYTVGENTYLTDENGNDITKGIVKYKFPDSFVIGEFVNNERSNYEVILAHEWSPFMLYTPSGALLYSKNADVIYCLQPYPNLGGTPSKSDVGSHTVVLRAANETGYTEQTFTINVIDTIAPVISALSPASDATNVPIRPGLSITFDEEVSLGTSGTLTLQNGESPLISFDLSNADERNAFTLSEDKKTLSFELPESLPVNTAISVAISSGFVKDMYDNEFDGITAGSGAWSFTTANKETQSITFPAIATKTYGDASFTLGNATTDKGLTVTYTAEDPSVVSISGNQATVLKAGTTSITATQEGDETHFAATPVIQMLTVSKKELTVTAIAKTKVYGDENPTLSFSYSGWAGSDDASVLDAVPIASTTVNETSPVNTYANAITLSGGSDNNYTFNYIPAGLEVTKATLTVTAESKTKIYGETNPTLTFLYSGWKNSDNESVLDTKPAANTTVTQASDVGTYTGAITVSGGVADNYAFSYVAADFLVTKANLTVTAYAKTKVYGEVNPTLTFRYSGWKNDDDESVLDTKPTANTTVDETSPVDTYTGAITVSGGDDDNYSFTYVAADFQVFKAILTVTADAKTKVYGEVNPTLSFQYSGWKNDETETVLDTKPTASTTVTQTSSVGTYTGAITVSGGVADNYTFSYVAADFQVTKATLTVTADAKTKVYGEANPNLTLQYTGWKNSDNESVLDTKPSTNTIVGANSSVGVYSDAIMVYSGLDNNYAFTYIPGDFEVTKATLTVTVDAQTKVYGEANPTLTFQYSGWKNDEDESVLDTKPSASTTVDETSSVGTYTDAISVSGGVDNNYSFTYVPADFEVTKAMLTVTKVYGEANPPLTFQYSGWKNSDDESVLDTKPTAGTTVDETSQVDTYSGAITVSGGVDNNYAFTYVSADFEVTKATLTVTADAQTKVYGESVWRS